MASRFLTDATMHHEYDSLKTASAQIVLGRVNQRRDKDIQFFKWFRQNI